MKKAKIFLLIAGILSGSQLLAQSLQEGINHLYAQRDKTAKETFEKMLATNPNNLDAIYWLGQSHLALDDLAGAKSVYSKALMTNGNAPLLIVGMGHTELYEKKKDEARQRFETAISLSSGRKGGDPTVLNAIGRANIDSAGDIAYAIDKLKAAAQAQPKNPDIFLNLGNAYRKAHDGGLSFTNYKQALTINSNFAVASYRLAKLFETQKNWEIYLQHLGDAIAKDANFAPAYYELYYYYLGRLDFPQAEEYARKFITSAEPDVQNDYLRVQTQFVQKNYDAAITGAKAIVAAAGTKTKPRVYKLLAYSYLAKADTLSAKQYIDEYFAKARDEEKIGPDYVLQAEIYAGLPNNTNPNIVRDSYLKAASLDSVLENKIKLLQEGIDKFKARGKKVAEAELMLALYDITPNKNPARLFFIGLPFYQGEDYVRADSMFRLYAQHFPDSLFGHYWSARANYALDTTMSVEPFASRMVQGYQRTLDLAMINPRYKPHGVQASKVLAGYYNNVKGDKSTAISYLQKGLTLDPADEQIPELLKILERSGRPARGGASAGNKPSSKK